MMRMNLSHFTFALGLLSTTMVADGAVAQSMCSSPNDTNCYRMICNGMDANGTVSNQGCGVCTSQQSPRWDNATVPVRVDLNTVPSGISASAWSSTVDTAFARWEAVPGSSLVFQNVGNATSRSFGGAESAHELFWITNSTEWQQKVGGGVNGALGVTVPRYQCYRNGAQPIFDADLVMNGAGPFTWVPQISQCNGGWCSSVLSTVMHELGHFVGVDHPCTACAWTIMSATSAYETEVPTSVDQAAMGALYPGTPGGLGYGCSNDNDCDAAPICATVGDLSYCTQSCGTCPDGFTCSEVSGEGDVCVFAGGALAPPAEIGATCTSACVDGATCIVVEQNATTGICFENCNPNASTCPNNYECFEVTGGGGVCVQTGGDQQEGDFCNENALCADGLMCVGGGDDPYTCHRECPEPWAEEGCPTNQLCVGLSDGQGNPLDYGACFEMGDTPEGGSCESPLDCRSGTICLQETTNNYVCYATCDPAAGDCADDRQECVGLQGVSFGVCDPLSTALATEPDPGPGGGEPSPGPGGEPEPEPGEGECRTSRGNYDCPTGEGCVGSGGVGVCEPGAEGETGLGGLCSSGADCNSGLCHNGVCTRPCDDDGCEAGYTCDEETIPGGLCKADSCGDDESICADGWTCTYTDANRYACARGVPQTICSCVIGDSDTSPPQWGLALAGLLGFALVGRRRRRR